jgi:cytochrome P450
MWGVVQAGRRNCVGMAFAVFSMEATLAAVLRRYQVSIVCMPPVKLSVLLAPDPGTLLRMERRATR